MAAPTTSVFGEKTSFIEERLGRTLDMFLQNEDSFFNNVVKSSMGVQQVDSRDYLIHRHFKHQVGGVIESGYPVGDVGLWGDNTDAGSSRGVTDYGKFYATRAATTYPDANNDIGGMEYRMSVGLRTYRLNKKMTLGEKQLDATSAWIGNTRADDVMAWMKGLARRICNTWYTNQAQNYRICGIGASTGDRAYSINLSNYTITFYPDNYATHRFSIGDPIDLVRSAMGSVSPRLVRLNDTNIKTTPPADVPANWGNGGNVDSVASLQTKATRIKGWVQDVDDLSGKVTAVFESTDFAEWATATQLGNNVSFVTWANSIKGGGQTGADTIREVEGIHSYLKFGGNSNAENYILGDNAYGTVDKGIIDVSRHAIFKSAKFENVGVLTEKKLLKYLDRVQSAFARTGDTIDTMFTTSGVIRAAYGILDAKERLDRTGRLQSLTNQGEDGRGFTIHHNGRSYSLRTSEWAPYGELVGFKARNNWNMMTPPNIRDTRGVSGTSYPVRLALPSLGISSGEFPLLTSSGEITEASQMPADLRMQFVPKQNGQIRGMKLTGITEERIYTS